MLGKIFRMGSADRNRIALLIFALSADAERQHKHVGASTALYEELTRHTLKTAEASGIPYFLFTEEEQKGNTFGERYTHAIRQIFALGYDGVITIGNDTPSLKAKHLNNAAANLGQGQAVIGPSLDGGFYLLAIPKSGFSEEEFLSVRWNSSAVFSQMQHYLQARFGSLVVLDTLIDLDSQSDISLLLDSNASLSFTLKKVLIRARKKFRLAKAFVLPFIAILGTARILNRGSPVLSI